MDSLTDRLKDKGWSEDEIDRAVHILENGKSSLDPHFNTPLYSKLAPWVGLILTIIGNLICSVVLIPFLLAIKHSVVYLFIIFFGIGFGFVFKFLLQDIEKSDPGHHVIAWIFIPSMGLITIWVIVTLTNQLLEIMEFNQTYNPYTLSFIYCLSIMFPYFYTKTPDFIEKFMQRVYHHNQ